MNRRVAPIVILVAWIALGLASGPSAGAPGAAAPPAISSMPDIDPALRGLLSESPGRARAVLRTASATGRTPWPLGYAAPAADPERLEVFLRLAPGALPPDEAIRLGDDLWGGRIALDVLRDHLEDGGLRSVRLSRRLAPLLDQSAPFLGLTGIRRVDAVTGEVSGRTGDGVVVGIVDTGVDFFHADFRHPDGRTRFLSYWDQGLLGTAPRGYDFGTEHSATAINSFTEISGRDFNGHGTHVLGIAAGNGLASHDGAGYIGVAPRAALVGVRSLFTEFAVAVGVRYIFGRADAAGLPAVVNLSLGGHYGPHLGTTPFEKALEDMTGPGRLIVTAAGNTAHTDQHAELALAAGENAEIEFRFPAYRPTSQEINFVGVEGWFDPDNRYLVTVIAPDGETITSIAWGDEDVLEIGRKGVVRGWHTRDLGRGTVYIGMEGNVPGPGVVPASGTWRLKVEALTVAGDPELDFWVSNWSTDGNEQPRFLNHIDVEETITVPGTAAGLLTVGAVATRNCWATASGERCYEDPFAFGDVGFFSGRGPTADGREKPELYAPGYGVVSCLASTISPEVYSAEDLAKLGAPDGPYWTLRGTSMAAPQVTGTVALLLERFPTLTFEQMKNRLLRRSSPGVDPRTGTAVPVLQSAAALSPITELFLSELVPRTDGLLVRWSVNKELAPARYGVYKGFSNTGPFHRLADARITGENPFEILDQAPEPGRTHVYRIFATDEYGLEEDLDTLRTEVPGRPRFVLRPPDPNPAREVVSVRYFLAPSSGGGSFELDVIDVRGRRIRNLASDRFAPEGREAVSVWDLRSDAGVRVRAGVYWVRLRCRPAGAGDPKPAVLTRRLVALP